MERCAKCRTDMTKVDLKDKSGVFYSYWKCAVCGARIELEDREVDKKIS